MKETDGRFHKDGIALLRRRVSYLPEIKREIESLLLSDKKRLFHNGANDAIAHLQVAENLMQEDGGNEKSLYQAFCEVERAKAIASRSILRLRTITALNLEDMRAGIHALRDERGWKTGDFTVHRLWSVDILPGFDLPGLLTIVCQPDGYRAAFGIRTTLDTLATSLITYEFSSNWKDPTTKVLENFDLSQADNRITLDGIEYDFEMVTYAYKISIRFSNPAMQHFVELEKALFQTAEQVSSSSEWQIGADYLSTWHKYI